MTVLMEGDQVRVRTGLKLAHELWSAALKVSVLH